MGCVGCATSGSPMGAVPPVPWGKLGSDGPGTPRAPPAPAWDRRSTTSGMRPSAPSGSGMLETASAGLRESSWQCALASAAVMITSVALVIAPSYHDSWCETGGGAPMSPVPHWLGPPPLLPAPERAADAAQVRVKRFPLA